MVCHSRRTTMTAQLTTSARRTVIALATTLVCIVSAAHGGGTRWLSFEPAVVELEGIVKIEFHFGPPNFGENPKMDQKLHIPILQLAEPISVRGDAASDLNTQTKENVREIQLTFARPEDYRRARRCEGHQVTVRGKLTSALLPNDFKEVIMNVAEVKWCEHEGRKSLTR